jgi:hypothetical protein
VLLLKILIFRNSKDRLIDRNGHKVFIGAP